MLGSGVRSQPERFFFFFLNSAGIIAVFRSANSAEYLPVTEELRM